MATWKTSSPVIVLPPSTRSWVSSRIRDKSRSHALSFSFQAGPIRPPVRLTGAGRSPRWAWIRPAGLHPRGPAIAFAVDGGGQPGGFPGFQELRERVERHDVEKDLPIARAALRQAVVVEGQERLVEWDPEGPALAIRSSRWSAGPRAKRPSRTPPSASRNLVFSPMLRWQFSNCHGEGCVMGQVLRGSATLTHAVRAVRQRSSARQDHAEHDPERGKLRPRN